MPCVYYMVQVLPKIIVIVGQTGSGKSALGLAVAKNFNGEVVSADSRTIYREMTIGTAKPMFTGDGKERYSCGCTYSSDGVVHHLIDRLYLSESCSVEQYRSMAETCIRGCLERGKLPILVGGTGQYIDSVVRPTALETGAIDYALREKIRQLSLADQLSELEQKDPYTAQTIDRRNPRRVARALEIVLSTGAPRQPQRLKPCMFTSLEIAPKIEKTELVVRIEQRVDKQLLLGLEKEVFDLVQRYGWGAPGLQSIGYREWQPFFLGSSSRTDVRNHIIRSTCQYAKRQLTWFKRYSSIHWLHQQYIDRAEYGVLVKEFLSSN